VIGNCFSCEGLFTDCNSCEGGGIGIRGGLGAVVS
jgi:hypothetical protein